STLRSNAIVRIVGNELAEAWRFITIDRRTWWAMVFVTLAQTITLTLAMLAPRYVVVEVGIQPEDSVFMFAPAGLGIFLMTLSMSKLARQYGELRLAYVGGGILAAALIGMGLLPLTLRVMTFLERSPLGGAIFGGQH